MIACNEDDKFIVFGVVNVIYYTNHRGEKAVREVIPLHLRYGTSPYHTQEQWLLECFETEKNAYRTLALKDVQITTTHCKQ